jgi:hypothetical protein
MTWLCSLGGMLERIAMLFTRPHQPAEKSQRGTKTSPSSKLKRPESAQSESRRQSKASNLATAVFGSLTAWLAELAIAQPRQHAPHSAYRPNPCSPYSAAMADPGRLLDVGHLDRRQNSLTAFPFQAFAR